MPDMKKDPYSGAIIFVPTKGEQELQAIKNKLDKIEKALGINSDEEGEN